MFQLKEIYYICHNKYSFLGLFISKFLTMTDDSIKLSMVEVWTLISNEDHIIVDILHPDNIYCRPLSKSIPIINFPDFTNNDVVSTIINFVKNLSNYISLFSSLKKK